MLGHEPFLSLAWFIAYTPVSVFGATSFFMTFGSFFSTMVSIFYLKRIVEGLGGKPPIWSALATMGYINVHIRNHGDKNQKRIVKLMYLLFFFTIIFLLASLILAKIGL